MTMAKRNERCIFQNETQLHTMKIGTEVSHGKLVSLAVLAVTISAATADRAESLPPLPESSILAFHEDWNSGRIDPKSWYLPRKKWGRGNHGVSPENVRIGRDLVGNIEKPVLICQANGDHYDGPVPGYDGRRTRVGGIAVTRNFFASGRYEVVIKIGGSLILDGGPEDPMRPKGAVPAVWTYGYRSVAAPTTPLDPLQQSDPLYNPHLKVRGEDACEYLSEIDFPEFGKAGDFDKALYNTYHHTKSQTLTFDVKSMIDGRYHTLTTDWRTKLVPIDGVTDSQVEKKGGFYWVRDPGVPIHKYLGNPLKRLAGGGYAVYSGDRADHYLDGRKVGENRVFVPSMAAQLNIGVWLPGWGGPAPWKQSTVSFASVRIWQFGDEGDVHGVIKDDIDNNYGAEGIPTKEK